MYLVTLLNHLPNTTLMPLAPSFITPTVAEQLDNLVNMAERVASPEFKRGFREFVRARAKAANSSLTYRDSQGRLVQ